RVRPRDRLRLVTVSSHVRGEIVLSKPPCAVLSAATPLRSQAIRPSRRPASGHACRPFRRCIPQPPRRAGRAPPRNERSPPRPRSCSTAFLAKRGLSSPARPSGRGRRAAGRFPTSLDWCGFGAPVAQGIERCPAEAEVASSNLAGRTPPGNPPRYARHDDFQAFAFRSAPELTKPGGARLRGELQVRVVRDLYAHIAECDAWDHARDAAHPLAVEEQFGTRGRVAFHVQHAQLAVHLPAIALTRDWLLARIAAFAEADVRLVEARFGREDLFVDLSAPARNACLDPPALELLLTDLVARRTVVEHFFAAEDQPGLVLLRLDLDLGREARAQQL